MFTHWLPPTLSSFSLDSFREHAERKGPHRARGWDAAKFNESKEGNKMSLRRGHSGRITVGSQESVHLIRGRVATGLSCCCLTEGDRQAGPSKLALVDLTAQREENNKTKQRRERNEWRNGVRGIGHVFRECRLAPFKGLTPCAGGVGHAQPFSKQWP